MDRTQKATLIVFFLLISSAILLATTTGYRARPDEYANTFGTISALDTGHLNGGYISGHLFETILASTLLIIGENFNAISWLSPLNGALIIFTIVCMMTGLVRRDGVYAPSIPLIIGLGILATPDIVGYFRQTTHAGHTHLMFFVSLFVVSNLNKSNEEKPPRWTILIIILSVSQFLYSYIWGALFWIAIAIYISLQYTIKELIVYIAGVTGSTIAFWIPGIETRQVVSRVAKMRQSLSQIFTDGSGSSSASSGPSYLEIIRSQYGSIRVLNERVSLWFLYNIGEFTVAVLSLFSLVHAVHRLWRRDSSSTLHKLLIIISLYFGFIFIIQIGIGQFVFARRLIAIPAILGLTYFSFQLLKTNSILNRHRTGISLLFIVILAISVPLGAQRVIVGDYADTNDVESVDWADKHNFKCFEVSENVDRIISETRYRNPISLHDDTIYSEVVYSSGATSNDSLYYVCE